MCAADGLIEHAAVSEVDSVEESHREYYRPFLRIKDVRGVDYAHGYRME
jgi:hypothetical protein